MVNTFLISSTFEHTAEALDDKRLGKQRVEAYQIVNTLEGNSTGWRNHPATLAWKGYVDALKEYTNVMIEEWITRDKRNNMKLYSLPEHIEYPEWMFCERIHYSHQARLIQKNARHYIPLFPNIPSEYLQYGYIWPSKFTIDEIETLPISQLARPESYALLCSAICRTGRPCSNTARYDLNTMPHCGTHRSSD